MLDLEIECDGIIKRLLTWQEYRRAVRPDLLNPLEREQLVRCEVILREAAGRYADMSDEEFWPLFRRGMSHFHI